MKIPDNTKIQSVVLKASNLEQSLEFFSTLLGFRKISSYGRVAELSTAGSEPYIIRLEELEKIKPHVPRSAGLYHIAIRYPDRKELARIFKRLFDLDTKFGGFSDHLVSEAIYLSDPDGNGVELYADKPREQWKWKNGEVEMSTEPLNLADLMGELHGESDRGEYQIHPDTGIGHIHLKVTDLNKATKFYHDIVGFDITTSSYNGALFFSAGGYHHHIGTNVWSTLNGKPAAEDTAGLESFTINIPDKEYLKEITQRFKDSKIKFEETKDGLIARDFDNIKIRIVS